MTELVQWIHERLAPDQDLDQSQLAVLAVELSRERRFWEHLVHHDPNTRYFHQLYRDPHLDVWLICWLNAQDTGYHDHDLSSGAVYVVEGMLCEDFFHRDADGWIKERTREHQAGSLLEFDSAYIHGLRHPGGPATTSIHAYSPALWRMGHYEPDDSGAVRRVPITYADELASSG
jgi:cysteine dioxygenase type I